MPKDRVSALPALVLLALGLTAEVTPAGTMTPADSEHVTMESLTVIQGVTVADARVAPPAPGSSTAVACLSLSNPTMYDVYVVSASTDVAESVELREPDGAGGTRAAASLTAAAYGSLELAEQGPHLLLKGLRRPLAPGDRVAITLVTGAGEHLKVEAVVE